MFEKIKKIFNKKKASDDAVLNNETEQITEEESAKEKFSEVEKSEEASQISEEEFSEEKSEIGGETEIETAPAEEVEAKNEEKPKKLGFFQKIVTGLKKTRDNFTGKIDDVIFSFKKIDEDMLEELEEILITADIGMPTATALMESLRKRIKLEKTQEPSEVKGLLKDEMLKLMEEIKSNELMIEPYPSIILVVGVNGVGKTTTIGKLANKLKSQGRSVLLAAGDTFRAAAIEQLTEWGNRSGIAVISHEEASDPASVIFDAIHAAKARNTDVLICDTAGRLHNKQNLMNELGKIFKVVEREYPDATREVLLVLDATTGQNALSQAKTFKEVCDITGIALTKLDGTAKGGVIIALEKEIGVPVKLVGVGEGIDDLQPFDNKAFIEGIFSE